MKAPILKARKFITDSLSCYTNCYLRVVGGLHYIKGNSLPYFSLTCDIYNREGKDIGGGADHAFITEQFPDLKDMAALHSSDINGEPMHSIDNGWYHYGGTKWAGRNNKVLADHLRIPVHEAEALDFGSFPFESDEEMARQKSRFTEFVIAQRPRWKEEAERCITNHDLLIYGDEWKKEEVE